MNCDWNDIGKHWKASVHCGELRPLAEGGGRQWAAAVDTTLATLNWWSNACSGMVTPRSTRTSILCQQRVNLHAAEYSMWEWILCNSSSQWQPWDGSLPFMRTIHYKKSFTLIHKRNVVQSHSATTRGCSTLFRAWKNNAYKWFKPLFTNYP